MEGNLGPLGNAFSIMAAASNCSMSNNPVVISELPSELTEYILSDSSLDCRDICNVSLTCHKLHDVAQHNGLWKKKLQLRWPSLLAKYPRGANHWWKDVYRHRFRCGHIVQQMLEELSPLYFKRDEISKEGFDGFSALMEESEHSPMAVIDELLTIYHDGERFKKLTIKYYAEKVLGHIQQGRLAKDWSSFLDVPADRQQLEKGAVLLAQWCQPTVDVTETSVCTRLDAIAESVRCDIQCRFPDHPASCMQDFYRDVLQESLWNPVHCRQVLETLNKTLYHKLGFCGNSEHYYNLNNSFINKVLDDRIGIPITLAIVYSAVARRLGVLCQPVNFPSHFLLKWKEHPMLPLSQQDTYIDAFHRGKFMAQSDCVSSLQIPAVVTRDPDVFTAIEPRKVFERMARNLIHIGRQHSQMGCLRNALEMYLIISPDDIEKRLLLARVNLHLNINLADVIESLQRIADHDQSQMGVVSYLTDAAQAHLRQDSKAKHTEIAAKRRLGKDAVKFSVGMIMKHKRYHYTCVIYGWDPSCKASQEWITQMGVHNLPNTQHQPFYNVLVEDGSFRYAAQENLELADIPKEISHAEVGKYFQQYSQTHYLPNVEKLTEYPDDLEMTRMATDKHYNQST